MNETYSKIYKQLYIFATFCEYYSANSQESCLYNYTFVLTSKENLKKILNFEERISQI
jgi:hypothetical protein